MPSIASLVQRLLQRLRPATPPVTAFAPEDIPKYPPFLRGLPAFHPDLLLQTQEPLVRRLQDQLKLTDALFASYILPCLRNYAAYVHLLPASQNHHHRGAGGLLRHGLEVAERAAAIAAEKAFFTADTVPAVKRAVVVEWQAACALAGLCHDLGKPIADVEIGSEDGTQTWDPFDPKARTIFDWCKRHQLERYYLRWRKNRHQLHETEGILVVPRILTEATLSWIGGTDPRVRMQLTQSIARGADAPGANLIAPIVSEADTYSVRADLRKWSSTVGVEMLAIPSQRYILDAMRELIHTAKWRINQAGGRVFVTAHGALLPWPGPDAAGMDVVNYLRKNEIPGISRDPDNLADILIDTGIAAPLKLPHGDMRYWRARITLPEGRDLELTCLRVPDKNYLIDHHTPPLVAVLCDVPDEGETAHLDTEDEELLEEEPEEGNPPVNPTPPTPEVERPHRTATPVPAPASGAPVASPVSRGQPPRDAGRPTTPTMDPATPSARGGRELPRGVEPATTSPHGAAPAVPIPPLAAPDVFHHQIQTAFPHVAKISSQAAAAFLRQRGPVGDALFTLANQAGASATCPEWLEPSADGAIWLHYPSAFAHSGTETIPERPALSASNLFTRNPTRLTSVLHDRDGHLMLRLENQVAFHWVACLLAQPTLGDTSAVATPPTHGTTQPGHPSASPGQRHLSPQADRLRLTDPNPPVPTQESPAGPPVPAHTPPSPVETRRPRSAAANSSPSRAVAPPAPEAKARTEHQRRIPEPAHQGPAPTVTAGPDTRVGRAPSPFRSPMAAEPISHDVTDQPAPRTPAPTLAGGGDPFIDRLQALATQDRLCAGLTVVADGFEIHSAHKEAIAKHLELKPKALDYLLSRRGQPRSSPDGIIFHVPLI